MEINWEKYKLLKPGLEERRLRAYLGDIPYVFPAPQVCTVGWLAKDWATWVTFTEPDKYGEL